MELLILAVLFVVILFFSFIISLSSRKGSTNIDFKYNNNLKKVNFNDNYDINKHKRPIELNTYKLVKIMTNRELWFYKALRDYFKYEDVNIFSKIRLADFVTVNKWYSFWERQWFLNKINRKHIDFLLVDDNWMIKCLIELDDKTHKTNSKTIENDKFKDELFSQLNLPLIRFNIWETWNFSVIKTKRK